MGSTLKSYPPEMAWAIVQAKNQSFAVPTQDLREMVIMPEVAEVPNTSEYIRGVINLRGRVLPLIDLRKRIGLASVAEENDAFCAMLEQREQDHRKWLNELEASVKEGRPFGLATDPHKCAFGKWYDTFHSDHPLIAMHLRKFDRPHKAIHGVAITVQEMIAQGQQDRAQELIEETRSGLLARLLELFAELRSLVRTGNREIALIMEEAGKDFAVSVDAALSVEKLSAGSVEELQPGSGVQQNGVVRRFGRRAKDGQVILVLETAHLMNGDEMNGGLPEAAAPQA
ncbi:MAG TPA: chemotaxis protein CheW [Bryobacteraceae bacterium]|nr:chemotaxis protein CheW [Bryobacteraceae bacterium]